MTFTKEQLIKRIEKQIDINATIIECLGDDSAATSESAVKTATMDIKILDIALAALTDGMEQEPVAYMHKAHGDVYRPEWLTEEAISGDNYAPLYAAPQLPQPVVDESAIFDAAIDICRKSEAIDEHAWNRGVLAVISAFRACRAAMLQGAEPVKQHFKLRDGWVAVPVEPTEAMVIAGFEAELREEFRDPEAWEAFEAMSGCEQAAHRAKLCWAAMIAAAPQQE